jgi:hypothetical protein
MLTTDLSPTPSSDMLAMLAELAQDLGDPPLTATSPAQFDPDRATAYLGSHRNRGVVVMFTPHHI